MTTTELVDLHSEAQCDWMHQAERDPEMEFKLVNLNEERAESILEKCSEVEKVGGCWRLKGGKR